MLYTYSICLFTLILFRNLQTISTFHLIIQLVSIRGVYRLPILAKIKFEEVKHLTKMYMKNLSFLLLQLFKLTQS